MVPDAPEVEGRPPPHRSPGTVGHGRQRIGGRAALRQGSVLAEHRPHLLIDGALIAAETIGADEIVIYLSRPSRGMTRSLKHALAERRADGGHEAPVRIVHTEHRYVAGESSAVVRRLSGGPSKPSFTPPHPSERGVLGRPTLVQNAETLAHAALIARYGDAWYRERGTDDAPGTTLLTISGNVARAGVYEVDLGSELVCAVGAAGGVLSTPIGVLIGGYFGTWLDADRGARARLTPAEVSLGCGIIGMLGATGAALSRPPGSSATWLGRAPDSAGRASTVFAPSPRRCRASRQAAPIAVTCTASTAGPTRSAAAAPAITPTERSTT